MGWKVVWSAFGGWVYSGTFTASAGDSIFLVSITDGCYDLSDNFVTVNIDVPNGGTVHTENGEMQVNVTAGDGLNDLIGLTAQMPAIAFYDYVITDTNGAVL